MTRKLTTKFVAAALIALGLGLLGAKPVQAGLKFVYMLDDPMAHKELPKPSETNKNRCFSYSGASGEGLFILDDLGQWGEITGTPGGKLTPDSKVYPCTVSNRNPFYLELHDAKRGVTVRIYDTACYMKTADSGGKWAQLGTGKWR